MGLSPKDRRGRCSPLPVRFWSRVEIGQEHECWLWKGASDGAYGMLSCHGRNHKAHRISYALCIGPLNTEIHILHTCDTPLCVNPSHLVGGTNAENQIDKAIKGRGSSILTNAQVAEIRADGRKNVEIAAIYGVRPKTIAKIKKYESRKYI